MVELGLSLPANEYLDRFDGSRWRMFHISGGVAILTEKGRNLLAHNAELRGYLRNYKFEATPSGAKDKTYRKWFKSGGNSDVYMLDNLPMVIKEAKPTQSIYHALDRMDYLYSVCEHRLPPYVRVPDHYGAVISTQLERQYLLMEKANEGITVAELLSDSNVDERGKAAVLAEFNRSKRILDAAIRDFSQTRNYPESLLPDWHTGNVIVDFESPVGNIPFTLWIIDQ